MARGDPPKRFEDLYQYFLGARAAAAAFYARGKADPEVAEDLRNYMHMVTGYIEAVQETYKLKKAAGGPS
jgi:hypothetical protein